MAVTNGPTASPRLFVAETVSAVSDAGRAPVWRWNAATAAASVSAPDRAFAVRFIRSTLAYIGATTETTRPMQRQLAHTTFSSAHERRRAPRCPTDCREVNR